MRKPVICILLFFLLLLAGCTQASQPTQANQPTHTNQPAGQTLPNQHPGPATSGILIVEPQAGPAPYLSLVHQAQYSIDVNSYLLTDHDLVSALVQKAQSGLSVEVIVAGNPYRDQKAVA